MKINKDKGIVIDIETSPTKVLMYGNIYEPVVVKILDHTQILSMAYRRIGENKTHYIGQNSFGSYKKGKLNDKCLLVAISEVLKDADYIVGHNSDNFDIKTIKERIIYHRLSPLPDIPSLDTKKLIKGVTKLPSNKLQHVTEFLKNGGKMPHGGMDMFIGCMAGDEKEWKMNEKYNKQDVDITYKDFIDILPYVKLPNTYSRMNNKDVNCSNPTCKSLNLVLHKKRRRVNGFVNQYQCNECGRYTTDTRVVKD